MSNSELIASFVAYLRSEKGAIENTISNYETDIRKFADWFATLALFVVSGSGT